MRLPRSIQTIADVIGVPLALRLEQCAASNRRAKGSLGYRVSIPRSELPDDHRLVQAVGREAATRLQKHFGSEILPYPRRSARRLQRGVRIAQDYMAGATIEELMDRHGVSHRTVTRVLAEITTRDVRGIAAPSTTPPLGSPEGVGVRVEGRPR